MLPVMTVVAFRAVKIRKSESKITFSQKHCSSARPLNQIWCMQNSFMCNRLLYTQLSWLSHLIRTFLKTVSFFFFFFFDKSCRKENHLSDHPSAGLETYCNPFRELWRRFRGDGGLTTNPVPGLWTETSPVEVTRSACGLCRFLRWERSAVHSADSQFCFFPPIIAVFIS